MTTNIRDFAYVNQTVSRKRSVSDDKHLSINARHDKRPRRAEFELGYAVDEDEDEALEGMRSQTQVAQLFQSAADTLADNCKRNPASSYDGLYGHADLRRTTVVREAQSYIICHSPQEALAYLRSNKKEIRRRIKHITFGVKAVAFDNENHWKGLCNYIQEQMCIESVMIPVPCDPSPNDAMSLVDDSKTQIQDSESSLHAHGGQGNLVINVF